MMTNDNPEIPVKTTTTVITADPERKINFSVYEVMGSEVYLIPEGHEYNESLVNDDNIVTTEDGLKAGMKLLCPTLFGWGIGIVSIDSYGQPKCMSESGHNAYFIQFAKDRPPNDDGTPACPRWVCTGSGNMKGLEKLMLYSGSKDQP